MSLYFPKTQSVTSSPNKTLRGNSQIEVHRSIMQSFQSSSISGNPINIQINSFGRKKSDQDENKVKFRIVNQKQYRKILYDKFRRDNANVQLPNFVLMGQGKTTANQDDRKSRSPTRKVTSPVRRSIDDPYVLRNMQHRSDFKMPPRSYSNISNYGANKPDKIQSQTQIISRLLLRKAQGRNNNTPEGIRISLTLEGMSSKSRGMRALNQFPSLT